MCLVLCRLFAETDKDKDKCLTKTELEKLVLDVITTGKMTVDKRIAVSDVLKTFDFNGDGNINEQEFVEGCKKWIDEAKQLPENSGSNSTSIFEEVGMGNSVK